MTSSGAPAVRPAFVEGDGTVSRPEFEARTDRLARALAARGVGAEDRVAIMLPNSIAFFEVWAAAAKLGAAVVLVNTHLKQDEVDYILSDSDAKVLVDDLAAVEAMTAAGGDDSVELRPLTVLAPPVFYTSGTTGRPKGVMYTHRGAHLNALAEVVHSHHDTDSVYLWTLPMFHCNGWCTAWGVTAVGGRHVCLRAVDPGLVWRLLDDERVEILDIAFPPDQQLEIVREAARRPHVKGILAQKPVAFTLDEAAEMVRVCDEAGKKLGVNHNMRYDQSMRALETLLDAGELGTPIVAEIVMNARPHWQEFIKPYGRIALLNMSIHHLDAFRFQFGDPERIYVSVRDDPSLDYPTRDGSAFYILDYADGLRAIGCAAPSIDPVA